MKRTGKLLGILMIIGLFSVAAKDYTHKATRIERIAVVEEEESEELVWHQYMDKAYEVSKETGKPILANFTGSDWCGWCIRLSNEVFKKPAFKEWADENVVLLELDYPRKKKLPEDLAAQNAQLQQVFQITGYPTIWLFNVSLNPENKKFDIQPLGKTGYVAGGAEVWIKGADQIIANGQ